MHTEFVNLIRHLARDIISQVPDFWRSSDPLNLGFLPTGRLASVNQTLLVTAYLNSTTVTLLLLPLFF